MVLGRTGLDLIDTGGQPFPVFMSVGFAVLMLEAGTEVDLASKELRTGAFRGSLAFLLALLMSIPAGLAIEGLVRTDHALLFVVLLAGSSAAVAFPTVQERALAGPAIALVGAWIALAEAVTAILMPLTLSGAGRMAAALLGDVLIVVVAAPAFWIRGPDSG